MNSYFLILAFLRNKNGYVNMIKLKNTEAEKQICSGKDIGYMVGFRGKKEKKRKEENRTIHYVLQCFFSINPYPMRPKNQAMQPTRV